MALPSGSVQDGRIVQFEGLAQALQQLVAQANAGRRIALALPYELGWHRALSVPPGLAPWSWRRWLCAQAEQLGQAPLQDLAFDVQPLGGQPLQVLLSVYPLELLDDWQGLAEAAGLEVVLLDDRLRVMRLALSALGLTASPRSPLAIAQAEDERCRLFWWLPGQAPQVHELDTPAAQPLPDGGCVVGSDAACARWLPRLAQDTAGRWSRLDPLAALGWRQGLKPPEDAADYLVALGLALRRWFA